MLVVNVNEEFCNLIQISVKAIIWTNVYPIHRLIYAALGGDELKHLTHLQQAKSNQSGVPKNDVFELGISYLWQQNWLTLSIWQKRNNRNTSYVFWRDLDNSYPRQLVPRTIRTQDDSYPGQLVPKSTRAQVNSYPRQLVPGTTRTQDNSYLGHRVPRPTRTHDNSYPRQLVLRTTHTQDSFYPGHVVSKTTDTR